jgi:polysaccharide biosynthesis protein PslH
MKRSILVVAPYLPVPADFGGAIRVFHLVRELARDHDVMLIAPTTGSEFASIAELGRICDVTAVPAGLTARHSPGVSKRVMQARSIMSHRSFLEMATRSEQFEAVVDRLFLTRQIDLVQYEFTQMALFPPPRPCPTIIDAHNIEHELLRRVARGHTSPLAAHLKRLESRKIRRLEARLWGSVTTCIATSSRDAEAISAHAMAPPRVVPNGVDTAAFARPARVVRRPHHVVFTGVMRHQPNVDGVTWYVERVHPLVRQAVPGATVSIVGADPPASIRRLASSTVSVTGRVDDVRPFLHEASAAIVPLLAGGGTRLKIVEAFAAGTPVVSTPVGAEGLDVRNDVELLIAADPKEFANSVVSLLTNPVLAERMTRAALRLASSLYDWRIVGERLLEAHQQAIDSFRSSTATQS